MQFLFGKKETKQTKETKKIKFNTHLQHNLELIKTEFYYPLNSDLIIKECHSKTLQKDVVIIYLEGMVDLDYIINNIMKPLMGIQLDSQETREQLIDLLPLTEIEEVYDLQKTIDDLLNGQTIVIVENDKNAYSINTLKYEVRAVEKPVRENVIKGPQEAFTECNQINRSLIRKRLRNSELITEDLVVGKQAKSPVNLLYVKNIIDPEIVTSVKNKLNSIDFDSVQSIEILEQLLDERPYSIIPGMLYTERPDRAVGFLMEGAIVLLMDSSSGALILPITFWGLFHTSEDMFQRWSYANFIRFIRILALFLALLTPALYIGLVNFHFEMLPTDLLLAISATRERVPLPVILEIIAMEISFELIREAGVRIPTPIGPTIGILGALILGQAAVEANIVSPILVIIVAITGLSSFAIADNSLNYMIRIARFFLLFTTYLIGYFGLAAGFAIFLSYLISYKSFGVPFLAPLTPSYKSSKDLFYRPPIFKQWLRPFYVNPQEKTRAQNPKKDDRHE